MGFFDMIKFIVGSIVILALIGGAVEFKSTDKDYSLIVNKEAAKTSVYNGVVKITEQFCFLKSKLASSL
jgi:hypothetical protein